MFSLRARKVLIKRVYTKYLHYKAQKNDRLNYIKQLTVITYTVIIKTKEEKKK